MRLSLLVPLLVLVGCTSAQKKDDAESKDVTAARRVKAALERLPKCAPGVEAGRLEFEGMCTLMACQTTCCNTCGWDAAVVSTEGTKTPLDHEKVRKALDLGDSSYDCELTVWREAVNGLKLSSTEPLCIVR
ncbi:MAG: hypothetical protein ACO1OB_24200 [Archangium sp.]